jgi:agmatine deiminase
MTALPKELKHHLNILPVPAEWAEQARLYTAFPSHGDLWLDNLAPAQAEVAAMIRHLVEGGTPVTVLAMGTDAIATATQLVGDVATVIPGNFGDIWLRDTGPIFIKTSEGTRAARFQTNGWGGKYDLEHDDTVGDEVAAAAGTPILRNDFIVEGGALEHDGQGTILTTRQCVLNKNRNGWSQAEAEIALKAALGANRVLWLDDGMMNDHTDGHIDNIARFVAPGIVACQEAFGEDDPNRDVFDKIAADLASFGLKVERIPSPGRYENEDGDVVPASHMNFIIGNKVVVVPTYGTASADAAVAAIQKLFPNRKVVGSPSNAVLSGGGSFHCITQQEPK